jgi:hypothetical protein
MIWGRTTAERRAAAEEWTTRFAWFPVRLWDGRWIWWTAYLVRWSQTPPEGGPGIFLHSCLQRVLEVPPQFDRHNSPPPPNSRKANSSEDAA